MNIFQFILDKIYLWIIHQIKLNQIYFRQIIQIQHRLQLIRIQTIHQIYYHHQFKQVTLQLQIKDFKLPNSI
jgi:hypothetical protein